MARGGRVIMTGLTSDMGRLQIAKEKFGVEHIVDVQKDDVKALVNELTNGYGADVCYDCTGAVPSMQSGMDLLRKKGQYVQIGLFAKDEVTVDFSKLFKRIVRIRKPQPEYARLGTDAAAHERRQNQR